MLTRAEVEAKAARRAELKTARAYKHALEELTASVSGALAAMDTVMKRPESVQRGEALARIANQLDLANDRALHFGLGKTFAAMTREKHRLLALLRERT